MSPPTATLTATPADAAPRVRNWPESLARRLGGVLVTVGCGSVLGIAAWLDPSAAGLGTHTQLGLPPCGWAMTLNRPCPTCGMTTAFADAAHARFADAFLAQPFGLLLALGTAAAFWAGLHVALTGSHLGRLCGRMLTPRVLWILAALAAAAWAYKWATWPG
jgi:hypothetical protein